VHRPSFSTRVPEGDSLPRQVCDHCGFVHYVNPRLVVGCVVEHEQRLLLCRRAIEPRRGYWTVPAGFMEERESTAAGAAREVFEEARARVEVGPLLALYNVPRISQVHLFYRARLREPGFGAGEETLETRLFLWDEVPWAELAFPSVRFALRAWAATRGQDGFTPWQHDDGGEAV
jgi:ADP-ribose pyrophosphatase YjhB (NUDIX family)